MIPAREMFVHNLGGSRPDSVGVLPNLQGDIYQRDYHGKRADDLSEIREIVEIHALRSRESVKLLNLAVAITGHAQNLYVTVNGDFSNSGGSISEYTPAAMQTTFASGLAQPRGLAFDSSGNLIVGATFVPPSGGSLHGQLLKFPPLGHRSVLGNAAHAQFQGVVTDQAGNVFAVAID